MQILKQEPQRDNSGHDDWCHGVSRLSETSEERQADVPRPLYDVDRTADAIPLPFSSSSSQLEGGRLDVC